MYVVLTLGLKMVALVAWSIGFVWKRWILDGKPEMLGERASWLRGPSSDICPLDYALQYVRRSLK